MRHFARCGQLDGSSYIGGVELGQPLEMPGGCRALPVRREPVGLAPMPSHEHRARCAGRRLARDVGANLSPCACELAIAEGNFAPGLIDAAARESLCLENQRIDLAIIHRQIPDPGGAILSAGQDGTSVGAKPHATDLCLIPVAKGR